MHHEFQRPMDRVVRYEVGQLLLRHRDGDVAPFVETVVRLDGFDGQLVGLRDRGREAIVADRGSPADREWALVSYRVGRFPGGSVHRGAIDRAEDVDAWLEEEREEFCWVHPRWRKRV